MKIELFKYDVKKDAIFVLMWIALRRSRLGSAGNTKWTVAYQPLVFNGHKILEQAQTFSDR